MGGKQVIIAALTLASAPIVQRCQNPIGWDADHQREICGPKVLPATSQNVAGFKQRWRPLAVRIGRLMFSAKCQRTSWDYANASDANAQAQMPRDPVYSRLSPAQREDVRVWYHGVIRQTVDASGKCR